jgi:hypothetical protein
MKKRNTGNHVNRTLTAVFVILGSIMTVLGAVRPELVSRAGNGDNGNGLSQNVSVSADGRLVVFESAATNLVSGLTDTNGSPDIFIRDTQNNTLRCISLVNPNNTGNGGSMNPLISTDGRYVVFASSATNLVAVNDTNGVTDVFRVELATNQIQMVSVNAAGTAAGNSFSGNTLGGWRAYDISTDGRYVVFMSNASDLTPVSDANAKSDVFRRDMQTASTRLVSINSAGNGSGNNESLDPGVTANGRLVVFTSSASNMIGVDGNALYDVFVYDTQTQVTKCASLSATDRTRNTGSLNSYAAVINRAGTRVAYFSQAIDLTLTPDGNANEVDVFIFDLGLGLNSTVSINADGTGSGSNPSGAGNAPAESLSISDDGRYVCFVSRAANLVTGISGTGTYNIYRRDLAQGRTELVSVNPAGTQAGDLDSFAGLKGSGMSRDGRLITFASAATNLTTEFPGNVFGEVYVRDMTNGITIALTLNSTATALSTNNGRFSPRISANGRAVVFESDATDLTPANLNATHNIFKTFVPTPQRAVADFDGDGLSDFTVYRPAQGAWYFLNNQATFASYRFCGNATDVIAPADYTGDGRTDYAVFRPSTGTWYISDSLSFGETVVQFGQAGDRPVPQDYDGDGLADLAVFRNGTWYVLASQTNQPITIQFGLTGDLPVPGDFDGDGKADVAVFRPTDGNWYLRKSSNGGMQSIHFGQNADRPVPADYDGDGKTDLALFRAGTWWILNSRDNSVTGASWGLTTDIPVAGSYDGDGRADLAVFRPAEGNWYVLRSSSTELLALHFGQSGDAPAPSALTP